MSSVPEHSVVPGLRDFQDRIDALRAYRADVAGRSVAESRIAHHARVWEAVALRGQSSRVRDLLDRKVLEAAVLGDYIGRDDMEAETLRRCIHARREPT